MVQLACTPSYQLARAKGDGVVRELKALRLALFLLLALLVHLARGLGARAARPLGLLRIVINLVEHGYLRRGHGWGRYTNDSGA